MHENSINAWKEQNPTLNKRCFQVYSAIKQLGVATDKQIMTYLGYTDPNKVCPRITDLKKAGMIEELPEKVQDPESRVSVRQIRIKKEAVEIEKTQPMVQDSLFPEPVRSWGF